MHYATSCLASEQRSELIAAEVVAAAWIADSMYVAPASLERGGFASAALVMWRPCVAYLLIVSAIALPALAALTAG